VRDTFAHSARAERREDFLVTELVAYENRHERCNSG
jgi:hypothetical protein